MQPLSGPTPGSVVAENPSKCNFCRRIGFVRAEYLHKYVHMSITPPGLFSTTQRRALCNPLLIGITSGLWGPIPVYWGIRLRSWRMSLIPLALTSLWIYYVNSNSTEITAEQKTIYLSCGLVISGFSSYIVARRIKNESFKNIESKSPRQELTYSSQVESEGSPTSLTDKIRVDLERAQGMKDSGLITDEEYSAMRSKILGT